VSVANATININQWRLLVTWQQNTNAADLVGEYWVYRWLNPVMALTNDAAPLSNRVGVVAQAVNTNLNTYLDNNPDSPSAPGASNFWYTVRAVSRAACADLLSAHSGPAWGVARQRAAPLAATGKVLGSCGTPLVMFQNFNLPANSTDTNNWNYRFTCQRRDPGVAWVQLDVASNDGTIGSLGPLYFPPVGDDLSADYTIPNSQAPTTNVATCTVGTYYGLTSAAASVQLSTSMSTTQRQEAVFLAGQLLETALNLNDPLLVSWTGPSPYCVPAQNVTPDPSGKVGMTFDYYPHLSRQNPWPNIATALGLELNFRRLLVAGGPATSVTVAASAWPRLGRVVVRTTPPIAALALLRPIPAGQDEHHTRVPKILPASPSAHWLGASLGASCRDTGHSLFFNLQHSQLLRAIA
jgi:hypothetical protein